MRYIIVRGSAFKGLREIEDNVNEKIDQGWVPVGGVSYGGSSYIQAMVKHDSEPDKSIEPPVIC